MDPESMYLNRAADMNIEKLLREKKIARVFIFWCLLGALLGFATSMTLFFKNHLLLAPCFAFVSSMIAMCVVYIHVQLLKDVWQIWTYQLKYWYIASFIVQFCLAITFTIFVFLGIYHNQKFRVESYYLTSVFVFVCYLWTFVIYIRTKHMRNMFTRYSLIEGDDEVTD